jgi:flagellar M-ring protein FliF
MITTFIQQFNKFWKSQKTAQRVTILSLAAAALVLIPVIIVWATTPSYSAAYRGLSETDAGNIVQKLADSGIPYKLENNGTVLVPSNQVYEVRLMMAREGIPANNSVGMELFSQSAIGMTEFTQKVNYQRAMEGELERTIASMEAVEAVRVHIVTPEKTLLAGEQAPTTASATIKVKPGQSLDAVQVRSITHLIASSIEGMKPENVVVVDTKGNMLASGSQDGQTSADSSQNDTHRTAEIAAAHDIQQKVQSLLDTVLGPNNSVVQASVVLDWTQRETTSQTFDPTPAAIRSSQKVSEAYNTNSAATGGIPGASSNLPTPVATLTTTLSPGTIYARNEETLNYEITQTQLKEVAAPGTIKKVSLSVMVDKVTDTQQLTTIKNAVAAAAGIDTARGDQLNVDTLTFDRTYYTAQESEMTAQSNMDLYIRIGTIAAIAIILALVLVYLQRLFRNLKLASSENWTMVMKPVSEAALPSGATVAGMMGAGPSTPGLPEGLTAEAAAAFAAATMPQPMPSERVASEYIPKVRTPSAEEEQLVKTISLMSDENPASVADIIQMWLGEDEKRHG